MIRLNQTGSHIVALAFGVLVVGVIAFAGYTVMQRQNDASTTASSVQKPSDATADPELTSASDELDSSSSQLDSGLNDSSLDADLNDML